LKARRFGGEGDVNTKDFEISLGKNGRKKQKAGGQSIFAG